MRTGFVVAVFFLGVANLRAQTPASTPFVPAGAIWRFLDNGSNQGVAWRHTGFDDSAWRSGPAKLGYGDNDEATTISFGPNAGNRYITTYFRRTFEVANPAQVSALKLNLRRDDGAIVYLNGNEVVRSNMPPGTVGHTTLASSTAGGTDETAFFLFNLSPASLVAGINTIAVEVHQISVTSTDLGFDLELIGDVLPDTNPAPVVALTAPADGAAFLAPGPVQLTATASDAGGSVSRVEFYRGSHKIGEDNSAPYDFTVRNIGPGTYLFRAIAIDNEGEAGFSSPVSVVVNRTTGSSATLFAQGSIWKYLDTGSDQGTAWRGIEFADNSWAAGPAKLGYGDGDEATVVSFGPDPNNKYITTYFRSQFTVKNPADISSLNLNFIRDDGLVVYLNGVEAVRDNLPSGTITHTTLASGGVGPPDETTWHTRSISPSLLLPGTNTIAAEVHQNVGNSSDLGFNAEIIGVAAAPGSGTLTRGPYLQEAGTDRMTVRWRSSKSVPGRVRYGPSPGNLSNVLSETESSTEHELTLTGLTPGTTYFYSVGSVADTLAGGDANHFFKTSPPVDSPVNARIWVLGDAGRANANQAAVRDAFYTFTGSRNPDLCLMLGDNAYENGTDSEYQAAVFSMYSAVLPKMPLWSCLGNHETANLTHFIDAYPYFHLFSFPRAGECGGVPSGTEHYFSFDYGNIHFISLDSMTASRSSTGAMADWLRADLASTTARWIIAFFHHPPYSKGSHNSDTETELVEMRRNILPILEEGGVDLVLSGHSHSYERSYLLDGHYEHSSTLTPAMKKDAGNGRESGDGAYVKPLTGPRDRFGAVYAVAGSSGGTSGGALNHPAMFISLNNLGSMVLDINGNRMDATFLRENNTTPDSFTIVKQGFADSDQDGISDEYELAHGLDRHDPADAALDDDGDGLTNFEEFVLGTAAETPDRFAWSSLRDPLTGNMQITFPTISGRTYRVWWSADLLDWDPLSEALAGTGNPITVTDDGSVTGSPPGPEPRRFYRVTVDEP